MPTLNRELGFPPCRLSRCQAWHPPQSSQVWAEQWHVSPAAFLPARAPHLERPDPESQDLHQDSTVQREVWSRGQSLSPSSGCAAPEVKIETGERVGRGEPICSGAGQDHFTSSVHPAVLLAGSVATSPSSAPVLPAIQWGKGTH